MSELILSGDTIGEGRIKINKAYSADTHVWSASTGTGSIIADNNTSNESSSDYSSILGGQIHNISGLGNSVIAGGQNNSIDMTLAQECSAIIGGANNVLEKAQFSVMIGASSFENPFFVINTLYTRDLETKKSRIKNVRDITIDNSSPASGEPIDIGDDLINLTTNRTTGPAVGDIHLDIDDIASSNQSGRTVEVFWENQNIPSSLLRIGNNVAPKGFTGTKYNGVINNIMQLGVNKGFMIVNGGADSAGYIQIWVYPY